MEVSGLVCVRVICCPQFLYMRSPWSLKIELDPALEESDTSTGLLDRREMEEISCVWVWCWHFKRCRRSCLEWWWWPRSKPSPWLTQTSWPTAWSRCQWLIHNSPTKSLSRTAAVAANVALYNESQHFRNGMHDIFDLKSNFCFLEKCEL